jgi:aspartate dehydrogenase
VGALLDHPEVLELARKTSCSLVVPSGGIAGLDGVKAACAGRVEYVGLTSLKPPRALEGAPFLLENGISLDGLSEPRLLFRGPAREAVRGLPDNLNVSASLSLAGIGPDRTEVPYLLTQPSNAIAMTSKCEESSVYLVFTSRTSQARIPRPASSQPFR